MAHAVSNRELRQRWIAFGATLGLAVTDEEARGLVRGDVLTGHDAHLNIARLLAYRAGVAAAQRRD